MHVSRGPSLSYLTFQVKACGVVTPLAPAVLNPALRRMTAKNPELSLWNLRSWSSSPLEWERRWFQVESPQAHVYCTVLPAPASTALPEGLYPGGHLRHLCRKPPNSWFCVGCHSLGRDGFRSRELGRSVAADTPTVIPITFVLCAGLRLENRKPLVYQDDEEGHGQESSEVGRKRRRF